MTIYNRRQLAEQMRDQVQQLVVGEGYTATDLRDLGVTDGLVREASSGKIAFSPQPEAAAVTLPGDKNFPAPQGTAAGAAASDPVVAIVAAADLARALFEIGVYVRSRALLRPVRRIATYLGAEPERLVRVRPILGRWTAPSTAVAPSTYPVTTTDPATIADIGTKLAALQAHPAFSADHFGGPIDVFVLGDPNPDVELPTGYKRNRAVQGTVHVLLADLINATTVYRGNNRTLSDDPNIVDRLGRINTV